MDTIPTEEHPRSTRWRWISLAVLVLLTIATIWSISEVRRGVHIGEALTVSGARSLAVAESTRMAALYRDSTDAAVSRGVATVLDTLRAMSRQSRAFQRIEFRELTRHVATAEARVESVQVALPRKKR